MQANLNVIFAGTPEFARVALEAVVAAGFNVPLVLTQPDRPAGRGLRLQASAVKQWAQARGIALAQPRSLRLDGKYPADAAAAQTALAALMQGPLQGPPLGEKGGPEPAQPVPTVMVVAAYGLILPQWLLDLLGAPPHRGCINIHGSLLPRWRGAAPIHRAIEAGDALTGITIMQMDAGLDTGDMLRVQAVPIAPQDTTATLHDTLAALGARLVVDILVDLQADIQADVQAAAQQGLQAGGQAAVPSRLQPQKQPSQGVSYAAKIDKSEARIDWSQAASVIERRVRAFNPAPGCTLQWGSETVKLWRSEINSKLFNGSAGEGVILSIENEGIVVQCGQGALCLQEVQRPGGTRISAAAWARSAALQAGMRFE